MQDALAANERINDIFAKVPTIKMVKVFVKDINKVKFENVELKYDDFVALKNINLQKLQKVK